MENGTQVKVSGNEGQFVLHEYYSEYDVFFSGGTDVTLFRHTIKYAINKQLPIKIIMFDSKRNNENILF